MKKYVILYGKMYKVTKVFFSEKEANEFMEENTNDGVIKVKKKGKLNFIILAKMDDSGISLPVLQNSLTIEAY